MKKLAILSIATSIVMLCSFPSVNAQLPWTEDFSDNNGEGVNGGCGATPSSCSYYSAPSDFTISGTYSGLNNGNDWFYVYLWGGRYWLEARDVDNEVCYTSNTLTAAGDIDFEIDLEEWGNLDNNDYVSVYLIIDGFPALVQTLTNDFGATTVSAYGISVSSSIAVSVCFDNNGNNDYQAIDEIRLSYSAVLPVELQDFDGKETDCNHVLNWTTASEENVSHFEIERSRDGILFETIGKVFANGNSTSFQTYTFTDESASEANYYYRLKIMDLDGTYELSKIIYLQSNCVSNLGQIELYPNPVSEDNNMTLRILSTSAVQSTEITIYDILGRPASILSTDLDKGENLIRLNTDQLSSGNYFIHIENINTTVSLPFIVVQD